MSMKFLDGNSLYHGFVKGVEKIAKHREKLNETNVFPVADGDTGTNLYATFRTITSTIEPMPEANKMLLAIADASLTGARGNSGIIVAQFISGWAESGDNSERMSTKQFGKAVARAVPKAYQAMANPVEGTMLTVIKVWAEAVERIAQEKDDFIEVLSEALEIAYVALKKTPEQLEVLRKASVVDSGAQGFVHFMEGVIESIKGNNISKIEDNSDLQDNSKLQDNTIIEGYVLKDDVATYKYCTEALLTGDNLNRDAISEQLADLGDSLIVAGNTKKVKVHMHTNQPDSMISTLRKHGQIEQQKADNMYMQTQMQYNRKHQIALMTDSIADLPLQYLEDNQIHLLPLTLMIENSPYLDKITVTPASFYKLLDEVTDYPSSSQPSVKVVEERLQELCKYYNSVVVITVAAALSGTWNAVQQAAETVSKQTGKRIDVIDSKQNSGAQGLLVIKANQALASGLQHQQLVNYIEQTTSKCKIYVSVDTFKYMVKNGRVSPIKGLVGKLFNIKPIISLDESGKGVAFGKTLSRDKNKQKIKQIVTEVNQSKKITAWSVVHAQAEELAEQYRAEIADLLGIDAEYVVGISPIVGLSAGKGAVAVSFVTE